MDTLYVDTLYVDTLYFLCRQVLVSDEEVSHLEGFADEFIVVGEVSAAVDAGVGPVTLTRQILTKCLRNLLCLVVSGVGTMVSCTWSSGAHAWLI